MRKFNKRILFNVDNPGAVNVIPVAKGVDDCKVMDDISAVLLTDKRLLMGVLDEIITLLTESPTIEMPAAVIVNGPALLFSIYMPDFIKIATGLAADAIPFAIVIALDNVKYGLSKDPSPVVSLPYFVT
jgi:hypothetical protein